MSRIRCLMTLLALLGACKGSDGLDPALENLGRASGPVDKTAPRPAEHPQPVHGRGEMPDAPPPQGAAGPPKIVKGEIVETMDASRYTYVHLQDDSGEAIWAAIPKAALEVGGRVEIVQSLVMKDFESKTLKRTFPSIVFGVLREGQGTAPSAPAATE